MADKRTEADDIFDSFDVDKELPTEADDIFNSYDNVRDSASVTPKSTFDTAMAPLETIGAGAVGLGSGATLGFGDNILAGTAALHPDVEYEQALERLREFYSKTQQKNPTATFLGEGVGSMALPSGAARLTAKVPGLLGFGAKLATEIPEAMLLAGAATTGHKDIPASEFGLTDGKIRIPKDVKNNALLGGLLSGGIRTGIGATQLAGKAPGIRSIKEGFQEGLAGHNIADKAATERKTIETMQEIAEEISAKLGEEGRMLPALLKKATEEGNTVSLSNIDGALDEINFLRNVKTTDEFLAKELDTIEGFLKDYRLGKETQMTIPGVTSVVPGKTTASAEDIVREQLKYKKSLGEAADIVGEPTAVAEQKLKERATKREAFSPIESETPLNIEPMTSSQTDMQALRVIGDDEILDVEVIKALTPGDIQTINTSNGPVIGMKLPSGKFYGKPVQQAQVSKNTDIMGSVPARSDVSFKTTPDKTVTERLTPVTSEKPPFVTGQQPIMSSPRSTPEEAYELRRTLNNILYGRAGANNGLKDIKSKEIVRNIIRQIDGSVEAVAPGFEQQLENVSTIKSALDDASIVGKGKTVDKATAQSGKKLFREAAKSTGEGPAAVEARYDIDQLFKSLKAVDPELAAKIEPKFRGQTKRFGLVSEYRDTPLDSSNPKSIFGSISSNLARGGAIGGYKIHQLTTGLRSKFGKPADVLIGTLEKLKDVNLPVATRNALIFKIAQDPSSREMLRSLEHDTTEFDSEE